jgi:hypothetical protein
MVDVVEFPDHLKCYAASLGNQFPTFRYNVMPLYSGIGTSVPNR